MLIGLALMAAILVAALQAAASIEEEGVRRKTPTPVATVDSLTQVPTRLFFEDRKLYDIAASAATGRWAAACAYEGRIQAMLGEVLRQPPLRRRIRALTLGEQPLGQPGPALQRLLEPVDLQEVQPDHGRDSTRARLRGHDGHGSRGDRVLRARR